MATTQLLLPDKRKWPVGNVDTIVDALESKPRFPFATSLYGRGPMLCNLAENGPSLDLCKYTAADTLYICHVVITTPLCPATASSLYLAAAVAGEGGCQLLGINPHCLHRREKAKNGQKAHQVVRRRTKTGQLAIKSITLWSITLCHGQDKRIGHCRPKKPFLASLGSSSKPAPYNTLWSLNRSKAKSAELEHQLQWGRGV